MRNLLFTLFICCFCIVGAAEAQESGTWAKNCADVAAYDDYPCVLGVWKAVKVDLVLWNDQYLDEHNSGESLEFTEQKGRLVKGVHYWNMHVENLKGHDGVKKTHQASEKVLGVFENPKRLILVDTLDTSVQILKIIDHEVIEDIFYEAGEFAVIGVTTLIRQRPDGKK